MGFRLLSEGEPRCIGQVSNAWWVSVHFRGRPSPVIGLPAVGSGRPQDAALGVGYNDKSLLVDRVGGGFGQDDAGSGASVVDAFELLVGSGRSGHHFGQLVAIRSSGLGHENQATNDRYGSGSDIYLSS